LTEETDLIDRLYRGEMSAFRELVDRYKKRIYYLAFDLSRNAADAEDISQEVFLKAFRSFGTFKRGAKLSSWLYRVTYNAGLDHLRRRSLYPETVESEILDAGEPVSAGPSDRLSRDPGYLAEQKLLREQVERALLKLSVQERLVFSLRHDNDLALGEIAEVMNISIGSVKSYLFRGLQKLRREISARLDISGKEGSYERL
jgi:RNA polymerase sigma-70 factor (ECF subfamily)